MALQSINAETKKQFETYAIDEAGSIIYVTSENNNGFWCIKKIDATSGTVITYATKINNPSVSDIDTARTNRASLVYSRASQCF